MESLLLNKVHNFGIYRKGGKRCILQLDFPGRVMLVIQKGHIKKTHPMSLLEHYDTEDGLHITMKLKDGEMVFEADNMEEKYTLCCLLGLVMQIGLEGDEDSIDSGHGHGFLNDNHLDNSDVIKDGMLEKKGHTAITTWNKRRIRLVPGELSYFKPGEELALNVIQLWKDRCVLKKHQHNGFTLTIRSRVYSFRTVHDYKATHMTEIARDDWYEAFERAMNMPPTTSKILDVLSDSIISMRHYHNDTRSSIDSNASRRSSNSSTGSNGSNKNNNYDNNNDGNRRGEHFYDSTPDVLEKFMASSCMYTQPIPKSLRGNTLPNTPTSTATATTPTGKYKHVLAFLKRSQSSEDLLDSPPVSASINSTRRQSREFHGISPLSSARSSTDHTPILASSADSVTYTQPVPKRLRGNTISTVPTSTASATTPPGKDKHILAFLKRSQSSEDLLDSPPVSASINSTRRQSREFHGISPLSSEKTSTSYESILATSAVTSSDSVDNNKEDIFSGTAAAFRAKLALKGGKSSSLKNYKAKKEMKEANSSNNYKMDGMKRGVCKAYNMFLAGADFRARSLDRNQNRAMPQFHPIIEVKSPTKTTPPEPMMFEAGAFNTHSRDIIQTTAKENACTTENTLHLSSTSSTSTATSSSPSSSSSSSSSITTKTPTHSSKDSQINKTFSENELKSDGESLLYSEIVPSIDIRKAFASIDDEYHDSDQEQTPTNPKELSTFFSSGLMPSTEAATLLIRDKPAITTTSNEPLITSTPTLMPKNAKNRPGKIPPLPVAPPPVSRRCKSPSHTHAKTKTDKPLVPPPAPPSQAPAPPPPAPEQPVPSATFGAYTEIPDILNPPAKQTNVKNQNQGLRLKQIHWTKVGGNQLTSSLWKDVSDVTDKLDLTELEEQFAVVNSKSNINKNNNNSQEKQMLVDAKRAQNLGILFCGLKLESIQRLIEAINSTTEIDSFPADRLATLKRYQPTTEELEMYRGLSKKGETTSLHDVDRFMVELCQIPKLGLRLDMVLTLWEFPGQYTALEEEMTDILVASDQLLDSVSLAKVLEYILAIGNFMNSTWGSKQDAGGFQMSSLDKILSVKGRDSKTTLCGYLVKQLKRNDRSLLSWPDSVEGVTKCSGYSTKAVGAEIDVLKHDLQKIKRSLKALRHTPSIDKNFMHDAQISIVDHDKKLCQLDLKYVQLTDKYKQLMLRFGEPSSNCTESIFTIVCGFVEKFNQAKMDQEV